MAIELNHTIVNSKNKVEAAKFLTELFNLPPPESFYHFMVVKLSNGVSLDYLDSDEEIQIQHYAFLVSDKEFDEIYGRIKERGITYWADPMGSQKNQINHHFGGRGLYFQDPSGHYLEIITKPYGKPSQI